MGRTVAKCGKCGFVAEIQGDGLCKRCYGQAWRAKNRPGNSTPAVLTLDSMFTCKKYRCRMAVKHCLEYQEMAPQQSDSDYFRAGRLTVDRRPCLGCEQGKVIAAAVSKNPAKTDATPENRVAVKVERQNKPENRRTDVGEGDDTGGVAIVDLGPDLRQIRPNAEVGKPYIVKLWGEHKEIRTNDEDVDIETMKAEVEEMPKSVSTTVILPDRLSVQEWADKMLLKHEICRKCGKRPAKNPNGLCEVCLSELGKEGYAKRGQKHDWLKWGLRDHPELYEAIKALGEREFRTPEGQTLWILNQAVKPTEVTR